MMCEGKKGAGPLPPVEDPRSRIKHGPVLRHLRDAGTVQIRSAERRPYTVLGTEAGHGEE